MMIYFDKLSLTQGSAFIEQHSLRIPFFLPRAASSPSSCKYVVESRFQARRFHPHVQQLNKSCAPPSRTLPENSLLAARTMTRTSISLNDEAIILVDLINAHDKGQTCPPVSLTFAMVHKHISTMQTRIKKGVRCDVFD